MENWNSRTELLIGNHQAEKLAKAHVLVAGLGGVGAAAAEMLCRAGVGRFTLADHDVFRPSNRNRQLTALKSTEGLKKTDVLAERLTDINPDVQIHVYQKYLVDDTIPELLSGEYDYILDAIDTLAPKTFLIMHALKNGQKIISSLGAGGRTDPALVRIADIDESYNCRFGHYLRKRLHKLGIKTGFKVVFSPEPVSRDALQHETSERNKKTITGTISYMPVIFGCFCAYAILDSIRKT